MVKTIQLHISSFMKYFEKEEFSAIIIEMYIFL